MPKNGIIADIIPALQKRANLTDDMAQQIRVFEVHGGKIHKVLSTNYAVVSVSDFVTLYAEMVPEEELDMSDSDQLVHCFHFDREPTKTHNVPFHFLVKEVSLDT